MPRSDLPILMGRQRHGTLIRFKGCCAADNRDRMAIISGILLVRHLKRLSSSAPKSQIEL